MDIDAPVFVRLHWRRMIVLETDEESRIHNTTRSCLVKLSSRNRRPKKSGKDVLSERGDKVLCKKAIERKKKGEDCL